MTTLLIILLLFIFFVVAIISPHAGGKLQKRTNQKAHWLKRCANWLWDPLTWWAQTSLEFARKLLVKIVEWGKKIRIKLPF